MPYIPIESYGPKGERSWSWSVPPKGFGLKHKVCFNQLPEQIREHYPNLHIFGDIWLTETKLVMESYPGGDRDDKHTDYWEKTTNGWILKFADHTE